MITVIFNISVDHIPYFFYTHLSKKNSLTSLWKPQTRFPSLPNPNLSLHDVDMAVVVVRWGGGQPSAPPCPDRRRFVLLHLRSCFFCSVSFFFFFFGAGFFVFEFVFCSLLLQVPAVRRVWRFSVRIWKFYVVLVLWWCDSMELDRTFETIIWQSVICHMWCGVGV